MATDKQLRVSSLVSNSPYVLVLDCDMHCNSRSSILEAMCFHLDHRLSSSTDLAFVQFPQMFHNLSCNDIYASELRFIFSVRKPITNQSLSTYLVAFAIYHQQISDHVGKSN